MDVRYIVLTVLALACAALCLAERTSQESEDFNDDAKRVFRYGKRGPGVFRYGKRDVINGDDDVKRIFRWGKRDGEDGTGADGDDVNRELAEAVKRIFRWGKRDVSGDDEADVIRLNDDFKRRLFNFGKRYGNVASDLDLRSDSPHVPFRFGEK